MHPNRIYVFEPTCAYCTAGSYALLSVGRSVRPSLDNNSYIRKYYSYDSETFPQYKTHIDAYRKRPITLSEVYFLLTIKLGSSYLGKYCSYDSETLPQHIALIGTSRKSTYYTLGRKNTYYTLGGMFF